MLDLIIRGGDVVDGTGAPHRAADVGVEGGRISVIGDLRDIDARTTVDATGKVVAPGFMVGHSALRRVVMGEEANRREATEDEIAAMVRLLDEGIEAGGIGFSSSWARTHNDGDGRMVPSRYATREELLTLAGATGRHEG